MIYVAQMNNSRLFSLLNFMREKGEKKLVIKLPNNIAYLPSIRKIEQDLLQALDYEHDMEVWLENFPFCSVPENARDHILPRSREYRGVFTPCCNPCKYRNVCSGFPAGYLEKYGELQLETIKDAPVEVMVEVEPRCNLQCSFCFNEVSFAAGGRNIDPLSKEEVVKIIDSAADSGVPIIRFTGGEPLLRTDLLELAKYAKEKGLEVRLNTNGILINENNAEDIAKAFDNILLPIESWSAEKEGEITGNAEAWDKKMAAIKFLHDAESSPVIRVGTVATRENINNFQKLSKIILSLPIDEWEFYRPVARDKDEAVWQAGDLDRLVDAIYRVQPVKDIPISLANAVPFCAASDPVAMNSVATGAFYDEGANRIVVDPRGHVKPHYFIDLELGSGTDLKAAWESEKAKEVRDLAGLPERCGSCRFLLKCRGGSRYAAYVSTGSWKGRDPLMKDE